MDEKKYKAILDDIKYIPVEWLMKKKEKNYQEQIYADDKTYQEYDALGFACEMVLVNYAYEKIKEYKENESNISD